LAINSISANNAPTVEFLVSHGADVNTRNGFGHTPLYYALRGGAKDKEIADFLRAHGAKE
jgi:ankyrin repeat protein